MRFQHDPDFVPFGEVGSAVLLGTLISGGQAGAERAVLDWAIENQVEHGGWCPQGRRAEDGSIPAKYELRETKTRNYAEALEKNIHESSATLIVTVSRKLNGALKNAVETARRAHKPLLHLSKNVPLAENALRLRDFIEEEQVEMLHITGSRASDEEGIEEFVSALLTEFAALEEA